MFVGGNIIFVCIKVSLFDKHHRDGKQERDFRTNI